MVDKVLHAQMPFTTGGQTINDRLTAAYHSLAGSQLGKTVCKATTEEPIGPKKKHLDYLLHCTHEPNVSIPQLANFLVERTTNTNWSVVYKSLITIHNLMCYGNERFTQYLASSNANFNLGNFLDKASVQGYDMSTYVRRYAKYIGEKIYTYRMTAFDFCKVKRGREDGLLRTMPTDKLLKTLPLLQAQVDALLEFQVTSNELTNGVINSCFILLFRDLIRLFACYNDGIINLLEKFFDMNKKQCREALDLYKQFLVRMDKVAEFLKVAESVGIDRGEIPDLAKAPSSLMEALEQHLNALEGQKASATGGRLTSPSSGPSASTKNAIQSFSSTYVEPKSGYIDPTTLDDKLKQKILEEEEQRLNLLKEQRLRELQFSEKKHSVQHTTSFEESRISSSYSTVAKVPEQQQQPAHHAPQPNAIDDLLSLDLSPSAVPAAGSSTNPFTSNFGFYPQQQQQPVFGAPSYSNGHAAGVGFANEDSFAKAFGNPQPQRNVDPLGDILTPQSTTNPTFNAVGPMSSPTKKPVVQDKLVRGDLDSSLASLAENLTIGKGQENLKNKPVQWGPSKTGAQTPVASSTNVSWNVSSQPTTHVPYNMYGYQAGWNPAMAGGGGMPMQGAYGQPRPMYPVYPAGMGPSNMAGTNMAPNSMGYHPRMSQDPFGAL